MSWLSSWWSASKEPPPTDERTARATEQANAEYAALARRFHNPLNGPLDEMPRHVAILQRALARRSQSGIFRLVYSAQIVIHPADFRAGTLTPQLSVKCKLITQPSNMDIERAHANNVRAIALSMEVVESDARQMPFSILWRAEPQTAVVASAGEYWCATQKRGSKRHVPTKPLISTPIGVENLSLNISFTSFEAVGFNSTQLMQNIAALTPSGAYRIPITYIYSGLLRNVHSACVLAEQRAKMSALEVETAPISSYQVAHDDEYMLMSGEDLQRAVAYIDNTLVPSNYDFNYVAPELFVEPFGGGKWLDAWQRALGADHNRAAVAGNLANTDAPPPPVSASLVFVVYVGAVLENGFNNGFAMPTLPASITTRTPRPKKKQDNANNNDDDDDNDETASAGNDGERRDQASAHGVLTMDIGGSVSEGDDGDDSEATARQSGVQSRTGAPPAAPNSSLAEQSK